MSCQVTWDRNHKKLKNKKNISKFGVQSLLLNLIFANSDQNLSKSRYLSFLVLSNFADFQTFCKIFCHCL